MSGAAEMRMREAHNGAIAVLITSTIIIDLRLILTLYVMRHGISVGTELYRTIGVACARKGMTHAIGANKHIDLLIMTEVYRVFDRNLAHGRESSQQEEWQDKT